jgi:hypothetical protein
MLDDATLSTMRAAQAATFAETCDVKRLVRAPDGMGGSLEAWSVHMASEPCRFAPAGQLQRGSDGVVRSVTETIITMRWDADVKLSDRIVYNAAEYSITGFKDHTWNTAKRCVVQAI